MKLFDKIMDITENDEDMVANAMLVLENNIYSEIIDIDAITKWEEIYRATKEQREIEFIPYIKTDVPQMIVDDVNFQKAVERKSEIISTEIFENMEVETFEKHIMHLELLTFEMGKMVI